MRRAIVFAVALLAAADAGAYELQRGDIIVLGNSPDLTGFGIISELVIVSAGAVRTRRGSTFSIYSFFVTANGMIRTSIGSLLDPSLRLLGSAAPVLADKIVPDRDGNLVAYTRGGALARFTADGRLLVSRATGSRFFDLASDQCTVAWLSATDLRLTNLCTGAEQTLAALPGDPRDVVFAPDGTSWF